MDFSLTLQKMRCVSYIGCSGSFGGSAVPFLQVKPHEEWVLCLSYVAKWGGRMELSGVPAQCLLAAGSCFSCSGKQSLGWVLCNWAVRGLEDEIQMEYFLELPVKIITCKQ